jgi:tetratricopeptide (TPR) repeat protein
MTAAGLVPDQIPGRNGNHVNQDLVLAKGMSAVNGGAGNQTLVFTGAPGVGKTAAAIELSFRAKDFYPDGRLFAQLSGGMDQPGTEGEVLRDFLVALGDKAQDIPDRLDARRSRFQTLTVGRRFQVFLDGAISASQVRTLLPGDGSSLILVTEGRPLSSLVAGGPVTFLTLTPLEPAAARDLLIRLIGADRVAAEAEQAAELIALCGHLPIALCVVGSMIHRSRRRSVASMVERLRDERRRLAALSRDEDLSVESVFNAAYRQLSDPAQVCYRALGLRPRSGETGVQAVAVALDLPEYEVEEAMSELADARLVDELGDDRYIVRELVQLHAEQLDGRSVSEREVETARLLAYYHRRTVDADAALAPLRPWRTSLFGLTPQGGGDSSQARAWLRTERANLRAAVDFADQVGEFDLVMQWCVLLWPFYEKDKQLDDLFAVHKLGILAAERQRNDAVGSLLHTQVGFAHYWLRHLDDAAKAFTKAVGLARGVNNTELEATASEGLGLTLLARQRTTEARETLRRNLELAFTTEDPRRIALAKLHLAKAEAPEEALVLLDEAQPVFAGLDGDETENLAKVSTWRGKKLVEQRRFDEAREPLSQALNTMADRGRRFDEAEVLVAFGDLEAGLGERDRARAHFAEALVIYAALCFAEPEAATRAKLTAVEQG